MTALFFESLWGACLLGVKLTAIVVPLVVAFELLRYLPFFRRVGEGIDPLMRGMGLSRNAAVPLFTGIFLGIAYGAGIIIRVAREKNLSRREVFLVGLFLATCHAVIEDTLIFVVIGGDLWIMLGVRLLVAVVLTALLARLWRPEPAAG
ncbi:nucleoside recognition domain-containing protein [Geoalkalibacter sp.]|uniref:nucleoside recognition domain-containing protein n=1 Tax=Geoalkalibacter sp. TaxID=3041440 RepID=UPI00272EA534|nr:nucleoside recognition domain-containing protein [Geoalkalibacter sp.]